MDLLNYLIGLNETKDPCFLCFNINKSNINIHTLYEIYNNCDIIRVSLEDMLNSLFPNSEIFFTQACQDCSDLICELFILTYNRKSKIMLLDCMIKQLIVQANTLSFNSITNNEVILNVQVPSNQDINKDLMLLNEESEIQSTCALNHVAQGHKCYKELNEENNADGVKKCPYCSEKFLQPDQLRSHLKVHRKKIPRRRIYQYCNDCNYKTLSKTTLQAHINKNHLNTRPHVCQICYKGFYNRSNLNEHVKTHNNERNHICELCGCSFIHKKSLIEHLRLHSDTRPYKCNICNKSFVTSGRRSDHIKRSHMEKTECCLICNKKYSMKKELTRHMNSVHLTGM